MLGKQTYHWVSLESRLILAIVFSVFQVFVINLHGSYIALALPVAVLLLPEVIFHAASLVYLPVMFIPLLFVIAQLVSLFWSVDKQEGIRAIIYSLYFILLLGAALLSDQYHLIRSRGMIAVWISFVSLAILIILFRIFPVLEFMFWHTSVGRILMNANVANGLIDGSNENNVLDPEKSGGVFANGNVAGNYLIMMLFLAIGLIRRRWVACIAGSLFIISIYMSGSKASILLVNGLLLLTIVISLIKKWQSCGSRLLIIFIVSMMCGVGIYGPFKIMNKIQGASEVSQQSSQSDSTDSDDYIISHEGSEKTYLMAPEVPLTITRQLERTLGSRGIIWSYGLDTLSHHWLKGHGFGGWKPHFTHFVDSMPERHWGVNEGMPPHNTLLLTWSQSGLAGLVLCLIYMFFCVVISIKAVFSRTLLVYRDGSTLCLATAVIALLVQGLGENWGLLGEPHQTVLFALALAILVKSTLRCNLANIMCRK